MRNFRKILSLILAIAMMLSTGISIMAIEPEEEQEYTVNFVLSPDIDPSEYDVYLVDRYYDYEKGKFIKKEIRNGDKVKPGTRFERNYDLGCSYYVDGKEIGYNYEMPNEDITIYVTPRSYGSDIIPVEEINEKPEKWVTVTLKAGEGKFRRNGRSENGPKYVDEIKLYVNPVREVNLCRKNQRTENYGKYILESPEYRITSNEIIGVFDQDTTVTVEYKDYKTVKLVLNKHDNSTKEITVDVDAKYSNILEEIRENETDLKPNEKFVCWSQVTLKNMVGNIMSI